MILFDAPMTRGFGGSGKPADWSLARQYVENQHGPKMVLAGGLKPENVAEAIRATGATAVDTASGVESAPGIKDPAAIKAFVHAARTAWDAKSQLHFVPRITMNLDWTELENRLYDLAAADIKLFAIAHPQEEFYGFAFDCNSDHGNVALCLNTRQFLRTAVDGSYLPPEIKDGYGEFKRRIEKTLGMKIYKDESKTLPEEREKELRWELGAWKYQGFNSDSFDSGWSSFERVVHERCLGEEENKETFMTPTQDRFMRIACRVLIRLELAGVFNTLNRTDDFETFVADHDESDDESWHRLNSVRNETQV